MTRVFLFGLVLFGVGFGFTLGGGRFSAVVHLPIFLPIAAFVVGSLMCAFGLGKAGRMFVDAFQESPAGCENDLRTNMLICECASRAALFGGAIAFLLEIDGAVSVLSGDLSTLGGRLASAVSTLLAAVMISVLIFRPLKYRFFCLQQGPTEALERLTVRAVAKKLLLGFAVCLIWIALTAAYMQKIVPYLENILRR